MRYTEAKLARISDALLTDLDKNTTDFSPNYDNTQKEPRVLPALLPNLLLNGTVGIAVGMATNIPHNLTELISGIIHLIDEPKPRWMTSMKFITGLTSPPAASFTTAKTSRPRTPPAKARS